MTHPSGGFVLKIGYPSNEGRWRAGPVRCGDLRASAHPAVRPPLILTAPVSRRGWMGAGVDPSDGIGAQPNRRLELAAPLVVELQL